MDVLEYIKKMQEMYGDDVITTADKINRPDPKPIVKEIEIFNEFNRRNPKADGGQLVTPSVDGSRPGYQGPGKGNPGVPKQYKTKMDQLYTPEVRKKRSDTRRTLFQKKPVGKRLQWIANNGQNYDSPLEMKKAYEKHFNHKIGSKADALFYTVKGGVGVSVDFGVGNLEVLNKRLYLDQIDNLTNPGKQKRGVFSFTKGFSEDEIFKASIIQNNPKVKKKFIDLFADINKNAGTYAELGPEEMVLKLKSKGGYLLDGYKKGGFDFLKSYPRPGDPQQTIGGVHKGITRNTLINAGIPVEHIKSFQLVRKPLESIEEVLRKVSTNPNYAKKVWGVGSGTSQKIANQLNNFLEGQKEARKIVRDLDTMFIKGQMNKEGYKGTVDSYLKTDAGKASSYNFTKVFGGVQFDHTLAKSIGKDYKYLPRNYLLKGQFTTGKFNRIKKDIFDLPLIEMLKKHKEGKISGTKIKEFIDDFNKKTGGYAEFTFDEKKGKIAYPQEKKVIYDLSRYSNPGEVAKELEKNIKMTMSDEFQKGYKGIISKEDLKSFKTIGASNILKNLEDLCPNKKASGGRIGYQSGTAVTGTVKCGSKRLEQIILKGGANKNEQVLAEKILKAGKGLKNLASLKGLLGPAALAFEVAVSVGLTGYDMLSQGKTFREAVGDSVFNYALGDRTKIDPKEERYKGYAAAGVDKDTIGKISAFENAMDEVKNIQQEFEKEDVAYRDAVIGGPRMSDAIKQKQIKNYYDQVKKNQELIKYLKQPQTQEKLKIVDDNLFPAMLTDADAKRKAMQMTKPLTVGFGNTMDFLFPKGFLSDTTYKEDREKAINYMPAVQEYYRSNQFAGGGRAGLSGGDTSGRPPESGPMSQGLRSLYNNGRKL